MWWKFAWYKFWGNHQEPFWVLQTTFANPHLERQKLAWTNIRNWLGQKKTSHVLLLQWVQPGLLLLPQANKHVCCWTPKNETLCHILQPPCSRLLSLFDRILEHVENSRLLSAMCFLCRWCHRGGRKSPEVAGEPLNTLQRISFAAAMFQTSSHHQHWCELFRTLLISNYPNSIQETWHPVFLLTSMDLMVFRL